MTPLSRIRFGGKIRTACISNSCRTDAPSVCSRCNGIRIFLHTFLDGSSFLFSSPVFADDPNVRLTLSGGAEILRHQGLNFPAEMERLMVSGKGCAMLSNDTSGQSPTVPWLGCRVFARPTSFRIFLIRLFPLLSFPIAEGNRTINKLIQVRAHAPTRPSKDSSLSHPPTHPHPSHLLRVFSFPPVFRPLLRD